MVIDAPIRTLNGWIVLINQILIFYFELELIALIRSQLHISHTNLFQYFTFHNLPSDYYRLDPFLFMISNYPMTPPLLAHASKC